MAKVKRIAKKRQNDFYDFLSKYLEIKGQTDPVADLANDARRDNIFPRGIEKTLDDFKNHLTINYKPIPNALVALDKAYEMYLNSM